MSATAYVTTPCPACRMILHLRLPIVVDEDGDPGVEQADIEQAASLHLRLACPAVPRLCAPHLVDEDEDEDEGVP